MNVAITGSTGFLGTHLLAYLQTVPNITSLAVFDKRRHSLANAQSLQHLVKNADIIMHLAGETNSSARDLYSVNVIGTANILKAMLAHAKPSCRFLFTSSCSVYKIPKKHEVVTESFPVDPPNAYGLSKVIAEELVRYFSSKKQIQSAILRISNPYGDGMKPFRHSVIATFLHSIRNGQPLSVVGSGLQSRDFIYCKDVVQAIWKAATATLPSRSVTINIASGEEVSLLKLISLMQEISKKTVAIETSQSKVIDGSWKIDTSRARKILLWRSGTSLRDGLTATWHLTTS